MLNVIPWFFASVLIAIWSSCIWVLHYLAAWSLASIGMVAGQYPQIDQLPIPEWLGLWIPENLIAAFTSGVAAAMPWVESLMTSLPSLAGLLTPVAWIVWSAGGLVVLLGAVAVHALILMRRRASAP